MTPPSDVYALAATQTGSAGSSDGLQQSNPDSSGSSGLSSGAKAGIGVGVAVAVILIVGLLVFFFLRRRKNKNQPSKVDDTHEKPELPAIQNEIRDPETRGIGPVMASGNARYEMPSTNVEPQEMEGDLAEVGELPAENHPLQSRR